MKERTAILRQLRNYLDKLNRKYNGTPLSDRQIEIFRKRMASYDVFFDRVREKNQTDPTKEPDKFLRLLEKVDLDTILVVGDALADLVEFKQMDPQQISLAAFAKSDKPSEISETLKLSKIKVLKKGMNGHS